MTLAHTVERRTKRTALVCLLLHLMVVGVVPFADAALDAAATKAEVHIEAERSGACAPVHDHLTCQLCRVLGRDMAPAPATVSVCVPRPAATLNGATDTGTDTRPVLASPLVPRAPPFV